MLDASPGASEFFHRRVLGELWSRYTHLENVVLKKLELCAISLTKAPGKEAWISSGIIVCMISTQDRP